MKLSAWITMTAVALALASCGGEAAEGEACDEAGGTEDICEEDTVCGKESDDSGELICLKVCKDQDDCDSGEDCNGVEGSNLKGCRPR